MRREALGRVKGETYDRGHRGTQRNATEEAETGESGLSTPETQVGYLCVFSSVRLCVLCGKGFLLPYVLNFTRDQTSLQRRLHDLGGGRDVWHSSADLAPL